MQSARMLRPRPAAADHSSKVAREIVETVVLTLLIFFAVHFSVQPYRVFGPSMQPGLRTDDYVLVNLLTYDFSTPQRGDVIVFYPPSNPFRDCTPPHDCFVKRVIALPGDTIEVTLNAVKVNNVTLSEPYLLPIDKGVNENPIAVPKMKLAADQYFVMGDNRLNSQDSRFFGPITRSSIIGKADLVMWPVGALKWLPNYANVFAGARP